jgi:AcrR family transcriptional regulator
VAESTKERLIECGMRRFYRDGFRNVGLDQILSDVGISKTAFYKHFESKEELMVAVLENQGRWLQNAFIEMIRENSGRSAADQLYGFLDVVQKIIEWDEFHGCIFVNAAMEFPLPHDPAHQAAAQNKQAIEQLVHDIAERAGAEHPGQLAEEMCMLIEGCYVTRTVTNDPATIQIARRMAEGVIQRHLG